MIKKIVLTILVGVLIVFSASISFANQIDGMISGTDDIANGGLGLPVGMLASINPGGLGDSLLYGYYNVRGNVNLFNVVNTSTDQGAKVRVVFRNAKNSIECLDFSICLSEGDVWTGFLIDNGTTAELCSLDTDTYTDPTIPTSCQAFKYDGGGGITGVTADDCREGYFEIVGMDGITGYDKADRSTGGDSIVGSDAACGAFDSTNNFADDVFNSLMGNNTIIGLDLKNTFSYNATAVADTVDIAIDVPAGSEMSIPAAMANRSTAQDACDETDFIFTKSALSTPYDVIAGFGATDVVVTFPTRLACHTNADFVDLFEGDKNDATAAIDYCTTIGFSFWDDKETLNVAPGDFSPSPQSKPCLPWEVNVLRLAKNAGIWNSKVVLNAPASFDLGWTKIDLESDDNVVGVNTHLHFTTFGGLTTYGLPAVAYTTQGFSVAPGYLVNTQYNTRIDTGL